MEGVSLFCGSHLQPLFLMEWHFAKGMLCVGE